MRASPLPLRHLATALGLVLPLTSLPASADPRAWVDPPKSAPAKPAEGKSAEVKSPDSKSAENKSAESKSADRKAVAATKAARPSVQANMAAKAAPAVRHGRVAHKTEVRERFAAAPQHRRAPYRVRLADTPAMSPAPVRPAPAGRIEAAQALALDYLSVVSAPGETMVGATPRLYSTRVRFYGRPTSLAALLDEKRGFVQRWPERRYAARAFSTQCSPDGTSCIVRAIVDFRAANPQRGAVSRGASELVLEVSFAGARPVIVAESGRVLHRDAGGQDRAETLAQGPGRG